MTAPPDGLADRIRAIGTAWSLLERSAGDPLEAIRRDHVLALESPAVLVRLARVLEQQGQGAAAHDLLEQGLALTGPAPQLALAHARSLASMGRSAEARACHAAALLRAQPDAALLIEHATLAADDGDVRAALAIAVLAPTWPVSSHHKLADQGRLLAAQGRKELALAAFAAAFAGGAREPATLDFISEHGRALPAVLSLPYAPDVPGGPDLAAAAAMMAAEAALTASADLPLLLSTMTAREHGAAWLRPQGLANRIAHAIAERRPFSYVRLGDGEARFLLARKPLLRPGLDAVAAATVGGFIWSIWFGTSIDDVPAPLLDRLELAFDAAVAEADVLGVPIAERLATDRAHAGYLVALERYVAGLPPRAERHWTDASNNLVVEAGDPFFSRLLSGIDFLGVVSPHRELAARLGRRLGIAHVASIVIPGEGRLGRVEESADRGQHFPAAYERVMRTLEVPRPGAVFLVAGGLLGKIYCNRIRGLGGIALDIGALADAWMGHDTRGAPLAAALRHVLPAV